MKPADASPSRCLRASSLLATTSLAALLLGGAPALAGGLSFDGQTQASVTNPANTTVTSIVINNSTVTGAVTNAGTISPGKAGGGNGGATAALAVTNNSTIGGGIHNSGTINVSGSGFNVAGVFIIDVNGMVNTIAGGISNTGTISASGAHFSKGLRRDLGEVQGRLEHQCELVPGRGLRRLGGRPVVRAGKRGRELRRFLDLAPAHALRASG
jgi:hypothetical protein